MRKNVKPNIKKSFNPIVFIVKVFVFLAVIANIGILGWVLRSRKLEKNDQQMLFSSYLSVEPANLDFGKVMYGNKRVLKIKITNAGKNTIYFSRIMSSHMEFIVQSQFSGIALNKDESVEISVAYYPVSAGKTEGKLTIESSDVGAKYFEVKCKGVGIMPKITVEPSSIDFGNIFQDNVSISKTILIKNSGTADLNVSSVSTNSQSFSISGALPANPLKPGESIKLTITYTPNAIGINDTVIVIISSDPRAPEYKIPVIAAHKKVDADWLKKQKAKEQLDISKRQLDSAYMKIYSNTSSEIRRKELLKAGIEEFQRAWQLYVQSNEELEKLEPSLVDKEYYVEKGMLKKASLHQ